jgi:hypothetical protein
MRRYATILLALSLGSAACLHDRGAERRDVAEMQNDGPVVSPWYGPVPNDTIYGGRTGDAR